jgi:hypothetical protein
MSGGEAALHLAYVWGGREESPLSAEQVEAARLAYVNRMLSQPQAATESEYDAGSPAIETETQTQPADPTLVVVTENAPSGERMDGADDTSSADSNQDGCANQPEEAEEN